VRSEFKQYIWEWIRRSPGGASWKLIQILIGHDKIAFNIFVGPSKTYPGVQLLQFPLLFPAILFSAMAIVALRKYRKMHKNMMDQRIRDRICTRCGYDLRATPDRCPECGTVPPRKEINAS